MKPIPKYDNISGTPLPFEVLNNDLLAWLDEGDIAPSVADLESEDSEVSNGSRKKRKTYAYGPLWPTADKGYIAYSFDTNISTSYFLGNRSSPSELYVQ